MPIGSKQSSLATCIDDLRKKGAAFNFGRIFTSAKEVMFLPEFVCLSVCVSKITQKVI